MHRILAVSFGLLLVTCSAGVWAEDIQDIVFYDTFESGDTAGWWAPGRVGRTGQTTCYDVDGAVIDCAGTGQDGDLKPGVAWPNPRFVDNADGTVTDMLTGLVWLKDANCFGEKTWFDALAEANSLSAGWCGLIDGSVAGDWHLASVNELQSLVDYEYDAPSLSNAAGTGQWTEGDSFAGVQSDAYWSSASYADFPPYAWYVYLYDGNVSYNGKAGAFYVWPVRNGL